LRAVFITHHHVDHFIGLDRIVRANIDGDKVLSIFGPPGTIQKVYDRIKSYEYQFFPFQKIVLDVVDVAADSLTRAHLECTKRFPPPEFKEEPRPTTEIFANELIRVQAAFVDHTVPCLAFALIEQPGYHLHAAALEEGTLKPGGWIQAVAQRLRAGVPPTETITIQGGTFSLGALAKSYFRKSGGGRLAYVTDTAWSEQVRQPLISLASKADRLYCDSFYAAAQASAAAKHRHMTALAAAELATLANVRELILMHFSTRYRGRYETLLAEARSKFAHVSAEIS
jgi:ribonuclease Z